ncbi:hypothetical protein [Nocardia sp. NPDC058666]|uniref:hypothetical protein n=2 Tax=Actinomycetes TaxID=1760 RepID=UPI003669C796
MGRMGAGMSYFTPEERELLNAGFAQILAERDERDLLAAIRDAAPQLIQAALDALDTAGAE